MTIPTFTRQEGQSTADFHSAIGMTHVRFAKEEIERRKNAPVVIRAEDVAREFAEHRHIYIVDPRLGFTNRTHRLWIDRIPAHSEEGGQWKKLGHRHTVEAVIYFLRGKGHSIIDGQRYDWEAGDLLNVPMFAWHRHINDGDEDVVRIASTTGPLSMALGQAVYEDERYPEYWVFANQSEEAMKTLIPWGVGDGEVARGEETPSARLYAEEVGFALQEEARRRASKVLVKGSALTFERTPMGNVAYMVDPRVGFHAKALATEMADIAAGKRSGAHRHLYDEIDYVVSGHGRVVVDDREYEIAPGDTVAIPMFAWHQYFCGADSGLRIIQINTRPTMENLGLVLTHQGELAD